jgi:hypothetical protein
MSQPAKRTRKSADKSEKSSKKGKPNTAVRDWIIRGVVFGVLIILLLMAIPEFQAGRAATGTADAWRAARSAKSELEELRKSEFDKIPVQGRPAMTSDKAEANSYHAVTVNTYVWKGTFRTHTVKVYFGMGNDPAVEEVEGPGPTKPQ